MPMSSWPAWYDYLRPRCALCALNKAMQAQPLCMACQHDLPWYDQPLHIQHITVYPACHYQYPLDRIIQLFKHQQRLDFLPLLSHCLQQIEQPDADAIIPMPISAPRLAQRGFNQSLLLATALGKHWRIPVWQPVSKHHRLPQQGLSRAERLVNLEGAFYPAAKAAKRVKDKKLIILDDVITTGSSILSLSDTLLHMGAKQTDAVCLALADL